MKLYKNKDELQILMDEYHTYKKVAEVLGCNEKNNNFLVSKI